MHTTDVRSVEFGPLVALRRPEVIIHLAAVATGSVSEQVLVGVGGTAAVLEAARAAGVAKVVAAVSAHVYGPASARDIPLREKHPHDPTTVAGLIADNVLGWLAMYRQLHQLEYTSLVLPSVYGPRATSGLVAELLSAVRADGRVNLAGGGRQWRDLIHVDDVVDALVRAIGKGSGVAMNISSGQPVAVRVLAEQLATLCGVAISASQGARPDGDPDRLVLDPGRARIHLGWEPFTPLVDGLGRLVRGAP